MTNQELFDQLTALIGRRVKINTASRTDDQYMMLDSVTQTEAGTVWIHNKEKGVAALVDPDDFDLEVEDEVGTLDLRPGEDVANTVRRIKFLYGNSGEDDRKRCLCPSCRSRFEARNQARLARLAELGYVEQVDQPKTDDNGPRLSVQSSYGTGGPPPDASHGPKPPDPTFGGF